MALDNNKLKVFKGVMETKLGEVSVLTAIAKGVTSGEITRGSSVDLLGVDDVNIGDYAGTITHQDADGTRQTVTIANQKYFSLRFHSGDLSQVPTNVLGANLTVASKKLALEADKAFVLLGSKAEVTVSGVIADVKGAFVGLATAFDEANVAMGDRAVVLDPATGNTLVDKLGSALNSERAASEAYQGAMGEYMGIKIYKSNQITATTTVKHCIGIDTSALVFPKSYDELDQVNGVDFFGIAIRGLLVFGVDVVETDTATHKSDRIIGFDIDHA